MSIFAFPDDYLATTVIASPWEDSSHEIYAHVLHR